MGGRGIGENLNWIKLACGKIGGFCDYNNGDPSLSMTAGISCLSRKDPVP
jgi:hypothetical protein